MEHRMPIISVQRNVPYSRESSWPSQSRNIWYAVRLENKWILSIRQWVSYQCMMYFLWHTWWHLRSVSFIGSLRARNTAENDCNITHSQNTTARQSDVLFNHLAPKLDIYSSAHHLCKMLIFYEPRRVTLGNNTTFYGGINEDGERKPKKNKYIC